MLMYRAPWSRSSPSGPNKALWVEVWADEIDAFMDDVPLDPQNPEMFDYAGNRLINPDFSLLRLRDPAGTDLGVVQILNGYRDGLGEADLDRLNRQKYALDQNKPAIYVGYLKKIVESSIDQNAPPNWNMIDASAPDQPAVHTVEHWHWTDAPWPDDFDVEVETWGVELSAPITPPLSFPAATFQTATGKLPSSCPKWSISTGPGAGTVVGYLAIEPVGSAQTQTWLYLGTENTIPPGSDGMWKFRRIADTSAPSAGRRIQSTQLLWT